MHCLFDTSPLIEDILLDFIVLTSYQEHSLSLIPRILDVTLHDTKPRTFVHEREYL